MTVLVFRITARDEIISLRFASQTWVKKTLQGTKPYTLDSKPSTLDPTPFAGFTVVPDIII
jgi:hypothetical protein